MAKQPTPKKAAADAYASLAERKRRLIDGVSDDEPAGRSATASLYVMVSPEQKKRYDRAAKDRGMKMREFVVAALEDFIHDDGIPPTPSPPLSGVEVDSIVRSVADMPRADVDVPWVMRSVTALNGRVAQLELEAQRLRLRFERRVGGWMHTHNAAVDGGLVKLYSETHGPWQLLYERDRDDPSWAVDMKGRLDRLDGREPGVVVETNR